MEKKSYIIYIKCKVCEHENTKESLEGVKIIFCANCGRQIWVLKETHIDD